MPASDSTIDTLLLLALPASGKSELRRFLDTRKSEELADLHLRPLVHLDDYPYVHLMRRISEELRTLGAHPVFFASDDGGWLEPRDWGVLIHLLNEDYAWLGEPPARLTGAASANLLLDRLDNARRRVGLPPPFGPLDTGLRVALCTALIDDLGGFTTPRYVEMRKHTVIIEFARGGAAGAALPLAPPHGYAYSLEQLSPQILETAAILYVWVEPEESRRRNRERARPGRDGDASILHHGVPENVMIDEYGIDDMDWLLANAERPGTVTVDAHGRRFHLPAVRFDNRIDRTSFLRADSDEWDPDQVATLQSELVGAFDALAYR